MPPLSLGPLPSATEKDESRQPTSILPAAATPNGNLLAASNLGPPESHFREFGDHKATRRLIYANVLKAAQGLEPLSNDRHTLRLRDVAYEARDHWTPAERKHALLAGSTLSRRLHGTWELSDNTTGQVIDRKAGVIARVPHLTDLGTFVNNGSDYTLNHQQRLRAGVFARRKENGELESHVNVIPGKGLSHRYLLDPEKGVFKIRVSQSEMPLLPLLRAMGATDRELIDHWGDKLFQANQLKSEGGVLKKLQDRLLRKADREHPDESYRRQKLVDTFHAMELDPEVTRYTLGHPHARLDRNVILKATRKLLQINRGEAEVDDRDHLAYQTFFGPEDLIAERVARDHGRLRRNLFFRASLKGHLKDFPSSAMTPQVEQALLGSGLGQALEEINPAEVFDKQSRITRMGEGGIPSLEAIPDEARGVQPSHAMFMDAVRTPESFRVGVDVQMARNARKGADGRIYTQLIDPRTGQTSWKAPQELHDAAIAFPGGLAARTSRIPVMKGGKIDYVKKQNVDFVMPHFEGAFSPLGNMVPLKSTTKAQRMAMASRMLTQALPLINAEAPLVQSAMPGTGGQRSFEEEYGKHMGAIHAPTAGRVVQVTRDGIRVRYADGHSETHELYDNMPFNRKTLIHHTPMVKPGDDVRPGQLLARSNYTDHEGTTALGTNLYTAYVPWKGYNFQDAIVVSEAAARNKLRSEHSYHHEVQIDDKHKLGKKNYISLFPGNFDRKTLDTLDDNGMVRVGTVIEHGHPLILAARERDRSENKVHKRGQAGYHDQAVVWKHHDPGVVTDVVMGKSGPVVLVKSHSPMQVGDKMCFDPETRVLTRRGWVFVADVSQQDEVASLNPKTGCVEWQRPTHVWAYDHDGSMYKLVTKHIDMLVTPEHRLWVARPGEEYRAVTAQEFYESRGEWQFKKDWSWQGTPRRWMEFPFDGYADRTQVLPRVYMDDWLEFLGYYVAEGWCDKDRGYVKIGQYQKSPAWSKIVAVLDRLGLRYRYNDTDGRFEIGNVWLCEQLRPLGDSLTKCVPGYVQDLPPPQLRIFLDAYLAGDGHFGKCWEYSTSSEGLAYDIQLICLKLGWSVTVKEVTRTDNWSKNRHWRGRINRRHLHPWWKKGRAKQYASNEEGMVPYKGKVYCITVPNHIIYVERRCKTYWSLNSGRYG